jgi:hypothetical protein
MPDNPVISADQLRQFEQEGYLLVKGLLDPVEDLDPVIAEYTEVLEQLAGELFADGVISSTYGDLPFSERFIAVVRESGQVHQQYFDFSLPQNGVEGDTPFWAGPAVFRMLSNERLLDAAECFVGPEIYSNPVQHVRLKSPEHVNPVNEATGAVQNGVTPWHQDTGVVLPEADETNMLTVWFPLTASTIDHGCLKVVPRSHHGGLVRHCPGGPHGLEIPENLHDKAGAIPMPMERGDVLFLTRLTIHSSLPNISDEVRWSFDLRYHPIGQPTGRSMFPGFIARSRSNPASELHDPVEWERMWREARDHLALTDKTPFNRWAAGHPACA